MVVLLLNGLACGERGNVACGWRETENWEQWRRAEATEQWRRAEAQALTALCKTKKSVECVKKGKGQRRNRKSRGTELSY